MTKELLCPWAKFRIPDATIGCQGECRGTSGGVVHPGGLAICDIVSLFAKRTRRRGVPFPDSFRFWDTHRGKAGLAIYELASFFANPFSNGSS